MVWSSTGLTLMGYSKYFLIFNFSFMFKSLVSTRVVIDDRLLALTWVSTLKFDLSTSTYGIYATIFSVDHIYHQHQHGGSSSALTSKSTLMKLIDECQILCIWTPWFALVRPLALLFSNVLVSFCVFCFCRTIREKWQIS